MELRNDNYNYNSVLEYRTVGINCQVLLVDSFAILPIIALFLVKTVDTFRGHWVRHSRPNVLVVTTEIMYFNLYTIRQMRVRPRMIQ